MKLYLIAVLLLAALVAVPSRAEEETKMEAADTVADAPTPSEDGTEDNPEDTEDEKTSEEQPEENPEDETIPEELKDEVMEHQKRRIPRQLSTYSCAILKNYGYCKVKGIARFCILTCCKDYLSFVSCRAVRYKYKACNKHVGRYYCRRTCRHCPGRPKQCYRPYHRILNDKSRRKSIFSKNNIKCDKKLVPGWYRMIGKQGTYIPNKCVDKYRCGTHAPGWVAGSYPPLYKTYTRKVCYHWKKKCCKWSNNIKITNCGGYYVFYLIKPPVCSLRYCGNL